MSKASDKHLKAAANDDHAWVDVLRLAGDTENLRPDEILGVLYNVKNLLLSTANTSPELQLVVESLCQVIAGQARKILDLTEEQETLTMNIERLAERLSEAIKIQRNLEVRASIDELTGLRNQGTFMEAAPKMFDYCKRERMRLSYAIFDLDKFKDINDKYGHAAGNFVLQEFAKMLNSLRPTDFSFRTTAEGDGPEPIVARDGGEEFSLLLPNTSLNGAATLAERLRKIVEEHEFIYDHPTLGRVRLPVTVSIGVAEVNFARDKQFSTTKNNADSAMYNAKQTSRNAVVKLVRKGRKGSTSFVRVGPEVLT